MSNEIADKENQNTFFLMLSEEIIKAMYERGDINDAEKDKLLELARLNFPCNKALISSLIAWFIKIY